MNVSIRKALDRSNVSLKEGYPKWKDTEYGAYEIGNQSLFLGRQSTRIPGLTLFFLKSEHEQRYNRDSRAEGSTPEFRKKGPLAETVQLGKNGRLFDLEEILFISAQSFGGSVAEHPFIRETIRKSGYDIVKAKNELLRYFKEEAWGRLAPFIYVKKDDAEKPLRRITDGKIQLGDDPGRYGFVLHPSVARMLESTEPPGDKKQLVLELKPLFGNLLDWDKVEATVQFLHVFPVNAFFFHLAEVKNEVIQHVLRGDAESAWKSASNLFDTGKSQAVCWIVMVHLNKDEVNKATYMLQKNRDMLTYVDYVKATGLIAMYLNHKMMKKEAEACFEELEKSLSEIGYRGSPDLLVEWQARAGLEGLAIQTLLNNARTHKEQDRLFEMITRVKPFEIDPKDFNRG